VYIPQQPYSSSSVPYAPPLFTQKEKAYYYEDLSKPPIICEIDEINADGTFEVVDLSDGRIIRTRIENLGKIFQPNSPSPEKAPSPKFLSQSPDMPEKASIFGVEEEKEYKEEKEEEKDKDKGENKKIIIDIKPE
jgi:hypothetical protein